MMQFKVSKRDLEQALAVVNGSQSNSGADISSHYLFRVTPQDGVEVLTYSGRVFSSCPVTAAQVVSKTPSAFTVEGKRLRAWLGALRDVALDFTLEGSEVVAKAPKGQQTFQSLDPSSFPFWDKMVGEAKVTATLPASDLAAALGYSKLFASTVEAKDPELCVLEVIDGVLYSTDRRAVTLIKVPALEQSKLRVHVKDVGAFQSFLGTFGGEQVEVLEHDRALIFRRPDGGLLGEARFQRAFPVLNVADQDDDISWTLSKDEIIEALGFLTAGAAWEDNKLRFKVKSPTQVNLSMASVTGKLTELAVNATMSQRDDLEGEVPTQGFTLDHFCLSKVLSWWKGDEIVFGINLRDSRGFVRFSTDIEGGDGKSISYRTILAWLR